MADKQTLEQQAEQLKELTALRNDYMKVLKEEEGQILGYTKAMQKLTLAERTGIGNVEELRLEAALLRDGLSETEEEVLKMNDAIEAMTEELKKNQEALKKSQERVKNFKKGVDTLTNSNISSVLSLEGFVTNIIKLGFALEDAQVELGRTTGYFSSFQDNISATIKRNRNLAISVAETHKIIGDLSTGMARFNMIGDDQQLVLQDISARFMRLGVDTKAFAEAIDTVNYSFGLTGQAAADVAKNLEKVAYQVGRPLGSVVKDLNEIGPSLARFGKQGPAVFAALAKQARSLGLTVKEAFDVSELFDTFEGAANIAGRLNAQLGLQLNSVELMKASSEDRIDLLRAEFQLQGLQFESMGRRQRQMIASILGKDEETAARLLGDRMDISAFQKEPEEKTIGDMVKAQEIMNGIIEQMALPIAEGFRDLVKYVKDHWDMFSTWAPRVLTALGAAKAVGFIGGLLGMGGAGGLLRGGAGALARLHPAGRALMLGTAVAGGAGIATGMGSGEKDDLTRSIVTNVAGVIGGAIPLLMGVTASVPTLGGSLAVGAASSAVAGAATSAGAGALYDQFFGTAQAPATNNAAMARATDPSRRSRRDISIPNITMPVTLEMDKKPWAKTTVNILDNELRLTSKS
jgi:hypothetical protein